MKEGSHLINLSGNFWSTDQLNRLMGLGASPKNGKTVIIDSPYPQKGVAEAIEKCESEGWKYDIISDPDNNSFLSKLSSYSRLVFLPSTPETLCRVVVEAKMMNLEVVTNELIGAAYEPWYKKEGNELISHMREFKNTAATQIASLIDNG